MEPTRNGDLGRLLPRAGRIPCAGIGEGVGGEIVWDVSSPDWTRPRFVEGLRPPVCRCSVLVLRSYVSIILFLKETFRFSESVIISVFYSTSGTSILSPPTWVQRSPLKTSFTLHPTYLPPGPLRSLPDLTYPTVPHRPPRPPYNLQVEGCDGRLTEVPR